MISDELRSHVLSSAQEQRVVDVRIGLGYTAVMLEDGNVGVAYTFRDEAAGGCSAFVGRRPLAGKTTTELVEYLGSNDAVESSLGLSVANALTNRPGPGQESGDIMEFLPVGPSDRVGMVGYFGPLVAPLQERAHELLVFERNPSRSQHVLPAEDASVHLPACDVAVITSTALVLGDLDGLLDAAAGCRELALVGASTPLVPAVFGRRGATMLSGITVSDAPGILEVVSEGGGMAFFKGRIRKVNIRL